jgi:pimeloyl-ACP methyl ester carboxylesterase
MKLPIGLGVVLVLTVLAITGYVVKTWADFYTQPPSQATSIPDGGITRTPVSPAPTSTPPNEDLQTLQETLFIDDQEVLVFRPEQLNSEAQVMIIFSHGSNEHVTSALRAAPFAEDLNRYGEYFSAQGAIFVASEMYGENWGSKQSREHIVHVIEQLTSQYHIEPVIIMYGFSMGGLPTLRFAKDYPDQVDLVLLLAPTIAMDDWNQQSVTTIEDIRIEIWHGTRDVNVPHSLSTSFVERLESLGHQQVTLHSVPDGVHRHFVEPERLWQEIELLLSQDE